jgi:hypothetical protein
MTAEDHRSTHGRYQVFALLGFVLGCVSVLDLIVDKTLVPILDGPTFADSIETVATGLGLLNLCAIVLIAASVVFAHVGYARTAAGVGARALAVAGLALGYTLLALYVSRVVVSIIALMMFAHYAPFVQNNFYWA